MSARDYDRFLHMLAGRRHARRRARDEARDGRGWPCPTCCPPASPSAASAAATGGTQRADAWASARADRSYLADGPGGMPAKGTYGWGGAAGTIAWVDPVQEGPRHGDGQLLPRRPMAAARTRRSTALRRRHARGSTTMIAPGFTGGTLDRADRAAPRSGRAGGGDGATGARGCCVLDGLDAGGDRRRHARLDQPRRRARGCRTGPARARRDGKPHFAASAGGHAAHRPGDALARADGGARPRCAPGEAATYAAARSVLDWHSRHRFCAQLRIADRDVPRRLGRASAATAAPSISRASTRS